MDRKQQNYLLTQLLKGVPMEKINTMPDDRIEQYRLAQQKREKEGRLATAIQHAKSYAALAHAFSDEVWDKLSKEAEAERILRESVSSQVVHTDTGEVTDEYIAEAERFLREGDGK